MVRPLSIPKLTLKNKWLDQHGGRNIEDIKKDRDGEYVLMATGDKIKQKVYIPSL